MSGVKWDGDRARALVLAEAARRLKAAAIAVSNQAKVLISIAGTGGGGRNAKGQFKRVYGSNPSAPGEPPHKQTGHLRRGVTYEVVGLVARVGTNIKYGLYLELGTRFMKARPWLKRALAEANGAVLRALRGNGGK